jgi:hypothetical protein
MNWTRVGIRIENVGKPEPRNFRDEVLGVHDAISGQITGFSPVQFE